jgi:uncharacterized protein YigA (DUF484 family)
VVWRAGPHIRSQALIALRNGGGTIGMIALGSEDAQRFYADMGTSTSSVSAKWFPPRWPGDQERAVSPCG